MNALELLADEVSWQLHKISPATSPNDIALRLRKDMSKDEIDGTMQLLNKRTAYRCRLGKRRWCFGKTAEAAAMAALNEKRTQHEEDSRESEESP